MDVKVQKRDKILSGPSLQPPDLKALHIGSFHAIVSCVLCSVTDCTATAHTYTFFYINFLINTWKLWVKQADEIPLHVFFL